MRRGNACGYAASAAIGFVALFCIHDSGATFRAEDDRARVAAARLAAIIIGTFPNTPWVFVQWGALVLMIAGAVLCYPFSKVLWLAADLIFRPVSAKEMEWHKRDGATDSGEELPHL